MVKGLNTAVVAAVLGMGLLGAAGDARADATDGEYNFSYVSTSANSMTASGVFNLSGINITSVSGNFADSSGANGAIAYSFNFSGGSTLFPVSGNTYRIDAGFGGGRSAYLSFYDGELNLLGNSFSGNIQVVDEGSVRESSGLFTATLQNFLNPVTPGSGSSTGGSTGSDTGGAGASGNAPSPEVNTLLGFLVVGGTVAFLKRRRKGAGAEMEAA